MNGQKFVKYLDGQYSYIKVVSKKDKKTGEIVKDSKGKIVRIPYYAIKGDDQKRCNEAGKISSKHEYKTLQHKKKCNTVCFFARYTNICIVDWDDDEKSYTDYDILKKMPRIASRTEGHYHMFFRCDDVPKHSNEQDVFEDFKGDLLCSSINCWIPFNAKVENWKGKIPQFTWEQFTNEIKMKDEFVFTEKKKKVSKKKVHKNKKLEDMTLDEVNKSKEFAKEKEDDVEVPDVTMEDLTFIIKSLPAEASNGYDNWFLVLTCIKNISEDNDLPMYSCLKLVHEYSSRGSDYDENETQKKYMEDIEYDPEGNNYGSLVRFLKKYNESAYNQLTNKYYKIKDDFEKTHFKVMYPVCYVKEMRNRDIFMINRKQLSETYENMTAFKDKKKKCDTEMKEDSFIKLWCKDKNIRSYHSMDFHPNVDNCPNDVYNLFDGFTGELLDVDEDEDEENDDNDVKIGDVEITDDILKEFKLEDGGNVKPMLSHLYYLLGENWDHVKYMCNWLSVLIQDPECRTKTAIVIKSEQGAGKNLFLDWIGEKIIGEKYFYSSENISELFEKHSEARKNKLLINIDETSGKDTFSQNDRLKGFITSLKFSYEKKYCPAIRLANFCWYIFTTNNDTPLKIEWSDRRFVCFESSSKYCNVHDYFKPLIDWMNKESSQKNFFDFLKNRDISGFVADRDRVKTPFYMELKSVNIPILVTYLDHLITNNKDITKDRMSSSSLFKMYDVWREENGYGKGTIKIQGFGREIKRIGGIATKRGNKGMWIQINKEGFIEFLKKKGYYECMYDGFDEYAFVDDDDEESDLEEDSEDELDSGIEKPKKISKKEAIEKIKECVSSDFSKNVKTTKITKTKKSEKSRKKRSKKNNLVLNFTD